MKKILKKSLAVFMVVAMVLTAAPLAGFDSLFAPKAQAKSISQYAVGDIVEFGLYPQSKVTDSSLLSALNSLSLSWISYGYYSGNGDGYYPETKSGDYMKYADVTYGGEKYRAVKFTEYRPSRTSSICSADNSYQDDNGYYTNNVYWFKYEPLSWKVLDPSTGFLLCEDIVDVQPYTNVMYYDPTAGEYVVDCFFNDPAFTNYASDYETSTIREWLNDSFYYTAFTSTERASINTSVLNNKSYYSSGYPHNSKYDSNTTNDKVFLLSLDESINTSYGFPNDRNYCIERLKTCTDYAVIQGGYGEYQGGVTSWLLRTPGKDSESSGMIDFQGGVQFTVAVDFIEGIVPAIKLNSSYEIEANTYSGKCGDNLTWKYNTETGELKIEGTGAMWNWSSADDTPWSKYLESIKTVNISSGATTIGDYAFRKCAKLTSVNIPDTVTSIGEYAFGNCSSLTSIEIPNKVTHIGGYAFGACESLTSIEIPDKITSINEGLFWGCERLTSVKIPDTVTSIEYGAFAFCESLTSVILPNNVTNIGQVAFGFCSKLEYLHIPVSTTTIGESLFYSFDSVNTYICSITENCTAKTYADANGIEFRLCTGHGTEEPPVDEPTTEEPTTEAPPVEEPSTEEPTTEAPPVEEPSTEEPTTQHKHTPQTFTIPASCTVNGMKYTVCAECGEPIGETTIIPAGHKWGEWETVKEATCKEEGKRIKTCSACGETMEEPIDKKEHTPGEWVVTKEATCKAAGEKVQKCTACGDILDTETIPQKEHTPGEWVVTKEATCKAAGEKVQKCTACGDILDTEAIPQKDHIPGEWETVKQATCKAAGEKVQKCTACGDVLETEAIPRKDHIPGEWVVTKEATCKAAGEKVQKCTACGDVLEAETIPQKNHTPGEWVVTKEATCKAAGEKVQKCTACGDVLETETIPQKDHTPGEWETILEPTTEADGKKIKKCTVCGDIIEEEIIPKIKIETAVDEKTGVEMDYIVDDYDGEVEITVKESFDGTAFDIIDTATNSTQKFIYDITMTVDGVETQPKGKVTVKIPLPAGYDPTRTFVYHVNSTTGKLEFMKAEFVDGFMVFETTHFSYYALVEVFSCEISINQPSITTVNYGDTLVLHADLGETELPEGYSILWTVEGTGVNISQSEDGLTCSVTSVQKGDVTVKATVVDENGEAVLDIDGNEFSAEQQLKSNVTFWQKIVSFFKNLFGISRIILQSI